MGDRGTEGERERDKRRGGRKRERRRRRVERRKEESKRARERKGSQLEYTSSRIEAKRLRHSPLKEPVTN
jgi:hypothetical protein